MAVARQEAHRDDVRGRRAPLRVRAPRVAFEGVPRHWLAGSAAATHVANGVNLLFPAGERFFVRSVRHYLPELERDARHADLVARVRGFFGQEGRHAQAHERFFEALRAQGYPVDAILARYERLAYDVIERLAPPSLRLSATVALEHFTAIMAEDALVEATSGGLLAHAHPALRQLLEWHAVEELEHKSVAFDVLAAVSPSYALRVAGMALAATVLGGFWLAATRVLLAEDGLTLRDARRELAELREAAWRAGAPARQPIVGRVFLRGIRGYLRRDFHPDDTDHRELARAALARLVGEGILAGDHA